VIDSNQRGELTNESEDPTAARKVPHNLDNEIQALSRLDILPGDIEGTSFNHRT
jgi:hypothetical protein